MANSKMIKNLKFTCIRSLIQGFILGILLFCGCPVIGNAAANGEIAISVKPFAADVFYPERSVATLNLNALDSKGNPVSSGDVVWSIVTSSSSNQAVTTEFKSSLYGLEFDYLEQIMPSVPATVDVADYNGKISFTKDCSEPIILADIVGERSVTVQAKIVIDGAEKIFKGTVVFGPGPLATFRLPTGNVERAQWADTYKVSDAQHLPAAELCSDFKGDTWNLPAPVDLRSDSITSRDYSEQTGLPRAAELRKVASQEGNYSWIAAGWPFKEHYWTGEIYDISHAKGLFLGAPDPHLTEIIKWRNVVCRR